MKIGRAIASGAIVWLLVLSLFGLLHVISASHESQFLQSLVACILIIPFSLIGAAIYYKNGNRSSGLSVGLVMVTTALLLDLLITVPLVEQPLNGTGHLEFFSNPVLWFIAAEFLIVICLYYKLKIQRTSLL